MTIHKEGYRTLWVVFIALVALNIVIYYFTSTYWYVTLITVFLSLDFYLVILNFFRDPQLPIKTDDSAVLSPCDGRIVVIEEVFEPEYFNDKRLQVSIFMSPMNVHINYYPISGFVKYFKYHSGKYLVAWHPKSSTENERTSIVIRKKDADTEILARQIAGSVARRVVAYTQEGTKAEQGKHMGFIKFGSRVDLFLPLDVKIKVALEQNVIGSQTVIAEL